MIDVHRLADLPPMTTLSLLLVREVIVGGYIYASLAKFSPSASSLVISSEVFSY